MQGIGRPHSLRTRMMLLVLLSFLPSVGLSGAYVLAVTRRFVAIRDERGSELVHDLCTGVDRSLANAFRFAAAIAAAYPDTRPDLATQVEAFRDVAEGLGLAVMLRDPDGVALPGAVEAAPALSEAVVAMPRWPAGLLVTDALRDPSTGHLVAHVLTRFAAGGLLDIAIQPMRLGPLLAMGNLLEPSRTVLADAAGVILASGDGQLVGQSLPAAFLQETAAAGSGSGAARWGPGDRFHVTFAHLHNAPGWTVSVWDPLPFRNAIWRWPSLVWTAFVALSLGGSMVAAAILAHRLVRPLDALTRLARGTAAGVDARIAAIPTSSVREFEALRAGLTRAALVLRHRAATERRALRGARDGQLLLASVINASADGITVTDLAGQNVLSNAAALAVLGGALPRGGSVEGRLRWLDREVQEHGRTRSCEVDVAGPGQAARLVGVVKSPWRDAFGTICGVLTVMRDVTAERLGEARLHALKADQADAAVLSAMGVMAAGLAHDLSQPLAAASNFLGAAARMLDGVSGEPRTVLAREAVGEGATHVLRAGEIVRALRVFLTRGRISPVPVRVADLLADACAVARADGSLGTVRLEYVEAPADLLVLADAAQMRQVLLNLIRNAAEAVQEAADGAGLIRIAASREASGEIVITVCDSGPGIARDVAERLFEPFVSTKKHGLGIGLAVCRTIVEAHGGWLTAQLATDDLGGARFAIRLPAHERGMEA